MATGPSPKGQDNSGSDELAATRTRAKASTRHGRLTQEVGGSVQRLCRYPLSGAILAVERYLDRRAVHAAALQRDRCHVKLGGGAYHEPMIGRRVRNPALD